jgi:hypothetical protein
MASNRAIFAILKTVQKYSFFICKNCVNELNKFHVRLKCAAMQPHWIEVSTVFLWQKKDVFTAFSDYNVNRILMN